VNNKKARKITTEQRVYIGIGLATILLIGGSILLFSKQAVPPIGQEITITGRNHVPDGTAIQYNSNPPAGGPHYATPQDAGSYTTPPPDGNLVHSLEHGAVILWYNPKQLSTNQIEQLKNIFNQMPGKAIMTPRDSMDVPVALSSWGRVLKLKTIDARQIKAFFDTNMDHGPEQAPI